LGNFKPPKMGELFTAVDIAVQLFYEKLNFRDIFSKHKSKGIDINSLLIGLLSYKLTENFSIKEAGKWLNQKEILDTLNLEKFHERVLYRTLELLGRNRGRNSL